MGKPRGALIADVTKTGPAEKAGIEAGDVVIEFNGKPIKEMRDLPKTVAETEIGTKVPVKVLRKGKEITLRRKWAASKTAKSWWPMPAVTRAARRTHRRLSPRLA